jgi:hypothetical protein
MQSDDECDENTEEEYSLGRHGSALNVGDLVEWMRRRQLGGETRSGDIKR